MYQISSVPATRPLFAPSLAIRWEGAQLTHHSLALINRELCLRLIGAGHQLSLLPSEPDQFGPEAEPRFQALAGRYRAVLDRPAAVHVRHQWPPVLEPPPEGRWVMIQPWEYGSLPRYLAEVMASRVDEIWVPSHYVRDCYMRSGIPAERIVVIANGVDTERFAPQAPPLPLATRKRFKFLYVGGTVNRKGIDVLLDAYPRAFRRADDVCLVIKGLGFYREQVYDPQIRRLQADPAAPEVLYLDEDLPPAQLPGLYTACDALVHPYRAEGFGLPIAEAMACGLPVIVTNYGACLDFCDAQTALLIPATTAPIRQLEEMTPSSAGYWWAQPDPLALAELMRQARAEPEVGRALGSRGRQRISEGFRWDQAADLVQQRLAALTRF